MRFSEFLVEYSRVVTQQRLGKAVYDKMMKDRTVQAIFGDDPLERIDPEVVVEFGIDRFESADPTANKQYVPWIARTYAKDAGFSMEDVLGQVASYLAKFHALNQRKKLPAPRNDINRYSSFGDFMSVIDEYDDPNAKQLTDKGQAKELYNDENIRVIIPDDQAAACYYGQGTRWCTAATKGHNYFDSYSNQAPLMIVIPKQPAYPGEKYQLWFFYGVGDELFASDDDYLEVYYYRGEDYIINNEQYGQFMNEKDHEVSLKKLMQRFGISLSQAISAYETQYPVMNYAVQKNFEDAGLA